MESPQDMQHKAAEPAKYDTVHKRWVGVGAKEAHAACAMYAPGPSPRWMIW